MPVKEACTAPILHHCCTIPFITFSVLADMFPISTATLCIIQHSFPHVSCLAQADSATVRRAYLIMRSDSAGVVNNLHVGHIWLVRDDGVYSDLAASDPNLVICARVRHTVQERQANLCRLVFYTSVLQPSAVSGPGGASGWCNSKLSLLHEVEASNTLGVHDSTKALDPRVNKHESISYHRYTASFVLRARRCKLVLRSRHSTTLDVDARAGCTSLQGFLVHTNEQRHKQVTRGTYLCIDPGHCRGLCMGTAPGTVPCRPLGQQSSSWPSHTTLGTQHTASAALIDL